MLQNTSYMFFLKKKQNKTKQLRKKEKSLMRQESTAFSLNFSSAGKGPSIAGKAKKNVSEAHFPGGRG